jgi:hypothetical protein
MDAPCVWRRRRPYLADIHNGPKRFAPVASFARYGRLEVLLQDGMAALDAPLQPRVRKSSI